MYICVLLCAGMCVNILGNREGARCVSVCVFVCHLVDLIRGRSVSREVAGGMDVGSGWASPCGESGVYMCMGAGTRGTCHASDQWLCLWQLRMSPWACSEVRRDVLAGRWRPWEADILLAPLLTFPFLSIFKY